jgi:hypothetical protein
MKNKEVTLPKIFHNTPGIKITQKLQNVKQ